MCNIRNYCTPSVVQHVFGMLLSLNLRLDEYRRLLADGAWQRSPHFCLLDYPVRELAGRSFGIIGYGQLGRAVARVAQGFGMRVMVSRSLRPESGRGEPGPTTARLTIHRRSAWTCRSCWPVAMCCHCTVR